MLVFLFLSQLCFYFYGVTLSLLPSLIWLVAHLWQWTDQQWRNFWCHLCVIACTINLTLPLSWVKPTDFFSMQMSVNKAYWKLRHQLLWHVLVCPAGTTYFSENYFKAMFSLHWISLLLINVTLYTPISFFHATWPLTLGNICWKCLSHRNSVCPSVGHTGRSVKNGAS